MNSKLFAGLDDTTLRKIRDAARVRHVAPNINVIVSGEGPEHLFLLRKGRARAYILTESGSEILVLWAVPGVVLGLEALVGNPPNHMMNVTTVTKCDFLVWDHDTICGLAKAHPELAANGFRLALHYLAAHMNRHANLVTESAETRLTQTLLRLAAEAGAVQPSGIAIDITNEQLSSLSDISRFTASRLLNKWEHERKLVKKRGKVTLRGLEALMAA